MRLHSYLVVQVMNAISTASHKRLLRELHFGSAIYYRVYYNVATLPCKFTRVITVGIHTTLSKMEERKK